MQHALLLIERVSDKPGAIRKPTPREQLWIQFSASAQYLEWIHAQWDISAA